MKRWFVTVLVLFALWVYVLTRPIITYNRLPQPVKSGVTPTPGWYVPEPRHSTLPVDLVWF